MRVIFLILSLFLVGCSKDPVHFQGTAHAYPYHIQIAHSLTLKEKKEIKLLLKEVFDEVDRCYNHWNPRSALSMGSPSPKVEKICDLAHSFCELTEGWYNPTLGGAINTLKKTKSLPQGEYPPSYDLDGMLKGYTLDLILEKLKEIGYTNIYAEWGGDILVSGAPSKKRKWRVLVENRALEIENGALATSGCEMQLFPIKNRVYTHIINPLSGEMIEVKPGMVHTVTALAPNGALADALATACMACGTIDEATTFATKMKEKLAVEFWITSYEPILINLKFDILPYFLEVPYEKTLYSAY